MESRADQWACRHQSRDHISAYQRVYADKRTGGLLWKNLRCQKQRKKRYGKIDRRGMILNRISIEERPAIVETRSRIGDWEVFKKLNHSLAERPVDYVCDVGNHHYPIPEAFAALAKLS